MSKVFHKVAVLMGGGSSEREISLMTGFAVASGLRGAGYDVADVVADYNNVFKLPCGTEAVFIALHGTFGEDGGAQDALERLGVPYTGSRAESARISFDKILTREAFERHRIPVARGVALKSQWSTINGQWEKLKAQWSQERTLTVDGSPFAVVIKPPRQGSSVGVTIARNAEEYMAGLAEASKFGDEILVEEFIHGREWTVPILGREVLPIVEVSPQLDGGWYSFNAKYKSGGTTAYSFPEDMERGDPAPHSKVIAEVRRLALLAFDAVGARSVARVDFRIAPDGSPFALELNSIPGCSESSILPKSAAKSGMPFSKLCAAIMEEATCGA